MMKIKQATYMGVLLAISCNTQTPQTSSTSQPPSVDTTTLSSELRPETKGQRLPTTNAPDEGSLELEVVVPSGINTDLLVHTFNLQGGWNLWTMPPAMATTTQLSEEQIKAFMVTADDKTIEAEILNISAATSEQVVSYRLDKVKSSVNVVIDIKSPSGTIQLSRIIDEVKSQELTKLSDRIDLDSTAVTIAIKESLKDKNSIPLKELSFEDIREFFNNPEIKTLKESILDAFKNKSNKTRPFSELPFIKNELNQAKNAFLNRAQKRRRQLIEGAQTIFKRVLP